MAGGRVLLWNGTDLPPSLRELPAGTYVVEAIDDAPALSRDEEQRLSEALAALEAGQGRSLEQVRETIQARLRG